MTGGGPGPGAGDGGRAARLAAALQGELAQIIFREVKDPRVREAGLLTVTQVIVTDDLRSARVWVSFVGGDDAKIAPAMKALSRVAGFVRGEAGRRLSLKRAPELRFLHDRTAEKAALIDSLLKGDE